MNLAGYLSWGHYGWYQDYDLHGQVGFYGNSSWYIMGTIESYNGTLCYEFRHHGQYTDWFSANAFGSTNYESTPVGAIANTAEPFGEVIGNPSVYLGFWASGKRFGTCAWQAGGLHQRVVLGDPFVKR